MGRASVPLVDVVIRDDRLVDDLAPSRLSGSGRTTRRSFPFHFREAAANLLTIDELDPFGKIPEFKFRAVAIARA